MCSSVSYNSFTILTPCAAIDKEQEKTPLKSTISEGFWSEWRGSNSRPRGPKPRVLSAELHPDIHFSAMIPRRRVKIKFFLSVVIPVVKTAFVPFSATAGNPANAGAARLCVVSPHPIPDTATALPNQARYQLRYTRIFTFPPLYHVEEENQSFFCPRPFLWANSFLRRSQ